MLRMEYGLNLEQSQKLIMTPELKQAIKILQFSTLELSEYLQQQVAENPVLELKETEEKEQIEKLLNSEVDWKEVFNNKSDLGVPQNPKERLNYSFEHYLSQTPTLLEHLTFQLDLLTLTPQEYEIGTYIIGNIDSNGYLHMEISELCRECGCSLPEAEAMLSKIQNFDPVGVGARNLSECLLLQLASQGLSNSFTEKIIQDYLQDLAEGKWVKIARKLKSTPQKVQEVAQVIKNLNPKPGSKFSAQDKLRYIIPDVIIEKVEGEYIILVNDSAGPRLIINPLYETLLKNRQGDLQAREFVEEKLNSALWLLKSIEQRRLTLYRVVNSIVNFQRSFFENGIKYLKPLTLSQVAENLGVHESTVSRATANKYVQTPLGIFELKFFFPSGVGNEKGTSTSAESVKEIIKELVAREDPKEPLSDQKLTEILLAQGITISRRTVAKYRKEIGILTAMQRTRY
jgi:RNA polymerase sigma-54 factor